MAWIASSRSIETSIMSISMIVNYNKWKRGDEESTIRINKEARICTRVYEKKVRFRRRCERERVKTTSVQKWTSGNDTLRKYMDRKRRSEWWMLAYLSLFWTPWQPIIYPSQREGIDDIEPVLVHFTVRTRTLYCKYSYTIQYFIYILYSNQYVYTVRTRTWLLTIQ